MAEPKYDITPAKAVLFADDIVKSTKRVNSSGLDYSVSSLKTVDDIIGGFHADGVTTEEIAATVFGFGCYVGEVFVRNVGAKWRLTTQEEEDTIYGVPLILTLNKDTTANPIGKVIKRLENGDEDNLPYFYHAFTRQYVRPWWRFW